MMNDIYIEERKSLLNASLESAKAFDKAILTLSAGAFAISLTFIRQIAPNFDSKTIFLLIISWVCFVICILFTLIAFLTSQAASIKQAEILDDIFSGLKNAKKQKNYFIPWTWLLNVLSVITFILGALFLAVFSIVNMY